MLSDCVYQDDEYLKCERPNNHKNSIYIAEPDQPGLSMMAPIKHEPFNSNMFLSRDRSKTRQADILSPSRDDPDILLSPLPQKASEDLPVSHMRLCQQIRL